MKVFWFFFSKKNAYFLPPASRPAAGIRLSASIDHAPNAGPTASMRELAGAANVSVPTLRHYFGDRDGVVVAAMGEWFRRGEPYL